MTQKNAPGYPLPSGELGEDEIVCQLVYLPDRPEYWQALLASVHYFSTWRAWERDTEKRGQDAAANWREAFELTMECWRMTCLDDITDRMDIMIDLLANQPGCCDTTTIGPVIITTTIINPGVGDDPTHWGETEVADWEEWLEYICYHAHRYVDILIDGARGLDLAVQLGSITVEFLSMLGQLQRFLVSGHPIGLTDAMEIYQGFKDGVDLIEEFDGLADRFEAARNDIVCAFMQGSSLSDAVEDAVDNNILWLLFYVWTDYASVQAMVYEGSTDGIGYLPAVKRDDCICTEPTDFWYTWNTDRQGWNSGGNMNLAWSSEHQALSGWPNWDDDWVPGGNQHVDLIETEFDMTAPIIVKRIKYRVRFEANGEAQVELRHRIRCHDKFFVYQYTDIIQASVSGWEQWIEVTKVFDSAFELRPSPAVSMCWLCYTDTDLTGQEIIVDDLRFYAD